MFDFKRKNQKLFPQTISRPIPTGGVEETIYLPVLELKKFLLKNGSPHSIDICI
jgi:hypothetical protein